MNKKPQRWSQRVTRESNALDLERGVFAKETPREIALSLKKSAEASRRRKAPPFQSAMSMLIFFINRAGKNLPKSRLDKLNRAKDELRKLYGKPSTGRTKTVSARTRTRTRKKKTRA